MHIPYTKESISPDCARLSGGNLPGPVLCFDSLSSTLDKAWTLAQREELPLWGSVLARSQTEGRGQIRRQWHSPPGNVYAVVRLPLEGPLLGNQAALAVAALALTALLDMYEADKTDEAGQGQKENFLLRLKWPNDLIVQDAQGQARKVGGILLEERGGILCAGMGINIAHAPRMQDLREHTALSAGLLPLPQTVKKCTNVSGQGAPCLSLSIVESLWAQLVSQMYFWYVKELPAPFPWLPRAEAFLLWRHTLVRLVDGGRDVCGTVRGLGPGGELRLVVNGNIEDFLSGSVSQAAGHMSLKGQQHE